jgi:putative ABC transport system permease protein
MGDMSGIVRDLRHVFRGLAKSHAFSAVAVLSLAIGIGANTAIFTLLDQVLLRRLPVKDPHELVALRMEGEHYGSNWGFNALSYPLYLDLQRDNQVFRGMFCRFDTRANLTYAGDTERVSVELVSGTYFPVLGVGAALGRTFTPEEDRDLGGHPFVVLSYAYWQARFAGDPGVVGRTVTINGRDMTIVGVAQAGFVGVELESPPQVFVPVTMKTVLTPGWDGTKERRWRWVNAFGRLKPGVTAKEAEASLQPWFKGILEMEVKEAAFKNAAPETREAFLRNVLQVLPGGQGRSFLRSQLRAPLWVLMGLTGGVLLIACANVAGLLVARAAGREREISIRVALGAGRGQILRLLLAESFLLAVVGAAAGLVLAVVTDRLVLGLLPPDLAVVNLKAGPDFRVFLFATAVASLTVLLVGLLPAGTTRADVANALKEQAGTASPPHTRFRKVLVGAQVALSVLLLVQAGLFARSLANLRDLGTGFPTENLVAFNLNPSHAGYDAQRSLAFFEQLADDLRATPGVREVGLANMGIIQNNEWDSTVTVEGHTPKPGDEPQPYMNAIGPAYFATLGVPVVAGRDFTRRDTDMVKHGPDEDDWTARVVIVNEKFARRFFGDAQSALGRHVGFGGDPGTRTDMEIVGVVKDIKYTNLRDEIPIQMFVPYMASRRVGNMNVYLRTQMAPETIIATAREHVRRLDPNVPPYEIRTMEHRVTDSLLIERLVAGLSTVFGLVAALLACVGLYGVMAYGVARRTREIGVRMALGAFEKDVVWLVLKEVIVLVGVGVVLGLPAALGLSHWVRSQLYGVGFADPPTLALVTASLAAAAGLAGYLPARRASRIDPLKALRHD